MKKPKYDGTVKSFNRIAKQEGVAMAMSAALIFRLQKIILELAELGNLADRSDLAEFQEAASQYIDGILEEQEDMKRNIKTYLRRTLNQIIKEVVERSEKEAVQA